MNSYTYNNPQLQNINNQNLAGILVTNSNNQNIFIPQFPTPQLQPSFIQSVNPSFGCCLISPDSCNIATHSSSPPLQKL
jgi:hypothetical protein